jgi:protein involved in ribonucleotide reduction
MTGIKGFFATVKMEIPVLTQFNTSGIKKELFSVASNVVESSY